MDHPLVSRLIGILEDPNNTLTGTLSGDLVRGYSAYDIAVQNGFTGTVEEWLNSLVGESGSSPSITATKENGITSIFADGVLIATINDGAEGDTPSITATKQNGITSIFADDVQKENEQMRFGEAIERAKDGAKIQRTGWNGKKQYVELATCISYKNAGGEVINVNHEAIGNQALAFVGTSGVQIGWLASQADMLADDWRVVEGDEENVTPE